MAKLKVAVFDHEGGWILTNPTPSEYENLPHVVNPDLSAVNGLSPEDWVLVNGNITPKPGLVAKITPSAKITKLLSAVDAMEDMKAGRFAKLAKIKTLKRVIIAQCFIMITLLILLLTHLKG